MRDDEVNQLEHARSSSWHAEPANRPTCAAHIHKQTEIKIKSSRTKLSRLASPIQKRKTGEGTKAGREFLLSVGAAFARDSLSSSRFFRRET